MNASREPTETQQEPAGVLIVHLEYESVQEHGTLPTGALIEVDGACRVGTVADGSGVDGCESGATHWALFLFPRDALGNVAGWFFLFLDQCAFIDALPEIYFAGTLRLH
jgi:hypothetical protein